jgi:hypothetical protein
MSIVQVRDPSSLNSGYLDLRGVSHGDGTATLATQLAADSTARITTGGLAPGQALKNYCGLITLTASPQPVSIATVSTAKIYLITDVIITTNDDVPSPLLVQVTIGAGVVLQGFINATKGLELLGIETQPQGAAGQVIGIVAPAGTPGKQIAYNILGVEQ